MTDRELLFPVGAPSQRNAARFERGATKLIDELPIEATADRHKRLLTLGHAAGSLIHIEHGHDIAHPEVSFRLLGVAAAKLDAIDWLSSKMTIDDIYGCWALPLNEEHDSTGRARYPVIVNRQFESNGEVAHRFVMRRVIGPLETAEVLDHICRNHACCNPLHLDIVSQKTNVIRGVAARRATTGQRPLY